jgi:hypothetical protein
MSQELTGKVFTEWNFRAAGAYLAETGEADAFERTAHREILRTV